MAAVAVIVYLAGKLVFVLRDLFLILALAAFLAVLLNPLVVGLQRWVPRRGWAVALVTTWAILVFAGLALAFGYPLVNGLTHFSRDLPLYVSKAQHGQGWIGHLVRRYHVQAWVARNSVKLESLAKELARPAFAVGKAALSLVATLGIVVVLVLLLLLEGPKLRLAVLGLVSPDRAARYTRLAGEVSRSLTGFMLGDFITSLIAGGVVFTTLEILGVPFPLLWGLWVALVDFLPTVGGALAGIPTVIFALGHSITAGVMTAVVFLIYTQIENHVLNPVIMSRTVKLNPLLVLVSVLVAADIGDLVGGAFGGFVAAVIAIPVAGAIQIVTRDVWQLTAPESGVEAAGADQ